ncbi:MAG: prolyl aminopeptidase [Steroidobacteraceae bacterium]
MAKAKAKSKRRPAAAPATARRPAPADGLYPALRAYRTGRLKVSPVHELYYEESGNPKGKPVVFLHGGPGGGTNPQMRRFFNPKRYRIVLFDQRGCGRSTPHASIEDNTTWDLVADTEKLRALLGIERWQVFGGSWGCTLALAYAQRHPERVTELVLRGVFLLRRSELEWFYQNSEGAASMFPDLWENFVAPIPEDERYDMMRAYYRRLTSTDARERHAAAQAWSTWEGATSHLRTDPGYVAKFKDADYAAAFARIECHYFVNGGFLDADDQLLRDVPKIRHIPAVIVQGRYDAVCPLRSAWHLHRAWPEASLVIVPDAGHSAFEPGIARALRKATDGYARR